MGRLFGTNGVRGVINEFLTPQLVLDLGRAIGTVVGKGSLAVARDSRMGGEMLTNALVSALISTGCSVIDIGPAPTPTLQFMVPRLDCVGGVVVTASHNPPNFNGLKVMGPSGIEVSRDVESQIEDIYFRREFNAADWKSIGSVRSYDTAMREYLDAIKSHVDVKKIRKRQLTVVVDGANSVGSLATPILLRDLGCKVVSINSQLDGAFPGRDPEPTPENVSDLRSMVASINADFGVAHDGDADRATFVDETGRVLWGDQSFAIVASHVLAQKSNSTLVTPVSSGRLIEDVARQAGAKVDWTEVGSVVVSHRIEEIGAELGGEENGGVFYPAHLAARDGAMTVALIVDIMAKKEKQLSELVSELPTYFSDKQKVPVPPEKKEALLDALLLLTKEHNRITLDGVKLILDDGWILVRPSGTEPLWRCFAEGKTQETAERLCKMGVELIQSAIAKS